MGEAVGLFCTVSACIIAVLVRRPISIIIAAYFLALVVKDEWLVYMGLGDSFHAIAFFEGAVDFFFILYLSGHVPRLKALSTIFCLSALYASFAIIEDYMGYDLLYTYYREYMAAISVLLLGISAGEGIIRLPMVSSDTRRKLLNSIFFDCRVGERCQRG